MTSTWRATAKADRRQRYLDAAAELTPDRLLEGHPPLLVGGEAVGAQAALREAGELVGHLDRGVARPPALHQTVREAHAERLLARDAPPGEDQVHRLAVADEAGEAHGTEVDQRHAPAPAEDAEDGVGGRHAEIAPERQLEAARYGVALDRGEDRLREQHARRPHGRLVAVVADAAALA